MANLNSLSTPLASPGPLRLNSSSKRLARNIPSTQASLLARLRQGADARSWAFFVELYTPIVYQYCRRRGLQDADARDVAQHVMARVFRAIGKFEYDPGQGRFRSWLGAIATREIIRYRHRDARPGKGSGQGEGDSLAANLPAGAEAEWAEQFNRQILALALERIRPKFDQPTWQAFDMTWLGDVEPQAAADRLGKTAAWVYKARFRVLKLLRAEVEFLTEDAAAIQRPT